MLGSHIDLINMHPLSLDGGYTCPCATFSNTDDSLLLRNSKRLVRKRQQFGACLFPKIKLLTIMKKIEAV